MDITSSGQDARTSQTPGFAFPRPVLGMTLAVIPPSAKRHQLAVVPAWKLMEVEDSRALIA
jgi:hypothetical protein